MSREAFHLSPKHCIKVHPDQFRIAVVIREKPIFDDHKNAEASLSTASAYNYVNTIVFSEDDHILICIIISKHTYITLLFGMDFVARVSFKPISYRLKIVLL